METMRWEMKAAFEKQDERFQAIRARYDQAVIEAGTRVQDLKSEAEALMRKEFQTGEDLSADKAKVRGKIEAAQKVLEAAEVEKTQAYDFARTAAEDGRITVRDLLLDWNYNYRKTVREVEFQPIFDRMTAAGDDYFNALIDFYELNDKYRHELAFIHDLAYRDNANHPGNNMMPEPISAYRELPLITDSGNIDVDNKRSLPYGIKRKKTGGEA